MKNENFIFFTITYEINKCSADNFLNFDFRKKLILFNETTLTLYGPNSFFRRFSGHSLMKGDTCVLLGVKGSMEFGNFHFL